MALTVIDGSEQEAAGGSYQWGRMRQSLQFFKTFFCFTSGKVCIKAIKDDGENLQEL